MNENTLQCSPEQWAAIQAIAAAGAVPETLVKDWLAGFWHDPPGLDEPETIMEGIRQVLGGIAVCPVWDADDEQTGWFINRGDNTKPTLSYDLDNETLLVVNSVIPAIL